MSRHKRNLTLSVGIAVAAAAASIAAGFPDLTDLARVSIGGFATLCAGLTAYVDRRQRHRRTDSASGTARILQLAPDLADFTNRQAELAALERLATRSAAEGLRAVIISGFAGVGKTALAVRACHLLDGRFDDGVIHLDLRGAEGSPLDPSELIGELLVELGRPAEKIGSTLLARQRNLRDELSERSMLVLLDNACDETQVRPFLAAATCVYIITSRNTLSGLESVHHIRLDQFDEAATLEFFTRVASRRPDPHEVDDLAAILSYASGVPLAVRILAGKIAHGASYAVLRARLDESRDVGPLARVALGDLNLTAPLVSGYGELDPLARLTFRRMSVFDVADFSDSLVQSALELDTRSARLALDALVDAHLLEIVGPSPAQEQHYKYHELIRDFARQLCADEDEPAAVEEVFLRGVMTYLSWIEITERSIEDSDVHRLPPRPWAVSTRAVPDDLSRRIRMTPVAWYKYNRNALFALFAQTHARGLLRQSCVIADKMASVIEGHLHWTQITDVLRKSRESAWVLADRELEAWILFRTGDAQIIQQEFHDAQESLEQCLVLFEELELPQEIAQTKLDLGYAYVEVGRYQDAQRLLEDSLRFFNDEADLQNAGEARCDLALLHERQGQDSQAMTELETTTNEFRQTGNRHWHGFALVSLAKLQSKTEGDAAARHAALEALPILANLDESSWAGTALVDLGLILANCGERRQARSALREASRILTALGDEDGATRATRIRRRRMIW